MSGASATLRVAIVGCGKIADAHVEQIRATGLAEVVAVCDGPAAGTALRHRTDPR